jgi:hypothetical protein
MYTLTFFNERKAEIDAYFDFLEDVINNKGSLTFYDNGGSRNITKSIDIELSHTLKANGYLLLYNLIESTMTSAIEEIHLTINDSTADADVLIESLAKQAIRSLNAELRINGSLSRSILTHWIEEHKRASANQKNPLFSGNVDARLIKEIASIYGFSHKVSGKKARGGVGLVKIKSKRNELAHGRVSFKDCGREIMIGDLISLKVEVVAYLEQILKNIEGYIVGKDYLKSA